MQNLAHSASFESFDKDAPSKAGTKQSNDNRLHVRRVIDAPLHEVSGICLRRGEKGRMSLIAVGDRVAKIAWFSLPRSDDGRIDWHTSDIAKLSGSMFPQNDPQIEAVCAARSPAVVPHGESSSSPSPIRAYP